MKTKRLVRCMALFLILLVALPVLTVFAGADGKYDYSYPSANFVNEIYPDDFLIENLPEITLLEEERAFLREEWGALVRYNSSIPTYTVSTSHSDGVLTVTAEKYDYVAENGTIVVWKPIEAELNGEVKKFNSAPYTVSFDNVSEASADAVSVLYSAEFSISEKSINDLLCFSYENAIILKEHIINKREEYERYLTDLDKYNEYLASLAVYNEYLSEYRIYEEKYLRYTEYLTDLEEYEAQKVAFRKYVVERNKYYNDLAKYTEYLAYAEHNQAKIDAYESYQDKYDTVLEQLDIIKRTKTPISVTHAPSRTVYGAIMGDTVTTVIDRKGDIVSVLKADGAVVDLAGEATENLRVLMTDFFEIKNVADQYKYYITNYEAFRDNFTNLLRALENLYCVSGVRGTMIEQQKYEKYIVLVAQLYYVANALSDEPIASLDGSYYYDENFVIGMTYSEDYKRISPSAALENQYFLSDNGNAEPLPEGFPIEPEKPDYLTVPEPIMPEPVAAPVYPEEVEEPAPPLPVSKPETVEKPIKVTEYLPSDTVVNLVKALDEGRLLPREIYTGSAVQLFGEVTVRKSLRSVDTVTVTYYDKEYDSGEEKYVLYSVTVDKNTSADYLGAVPYKAEDAEYCYTHSGWTDKNGEPLDLSSVSESIDAYPSFEASEQIYETFWVMPDGTVYNDNPGLPDLPEADYYEFDFGWGDPVFDTEKGTKTFYAGYLTERPLANTDFGNLKVYFDGSVFSLTQARGTNTVNIANLLDRASGSYGIKIHTTAGASLSFSISEALAMKRAGVHSLSFKIDKKVTVEAFGENGEQIRGTDFTVTLPFSSDDPSHLVVSYRNDSGRNVVRHKITEDGAFAVFNAKTGTTYLMRTEYSLTAPPLLDGVVITLSHSEAEVGETVGVTVTAPDGIAVERIYVKQNIQGGVELDVENSSFKMPAYDVMVGVEYKKLTYTVSFVSDGRALITKTYCYGDTVAVPDDPSKASNDKFSYVFKGWSPEVSLTVTGNATYSAIYEAHPIPPKDKDNDKMTPTVLKLVLLASVGLSCITFIVIPSSVINLVLKKRRKSHVFKLN